jgi:excisionase family DNA binding protein
MNVTNKESNGLLSVSKTATALGVKEATIRSWILYRRLEVVRIGRRVLVRAETVETRITRGTVPPLKGRELA